MIIVFFYLFFFFQAEDGIRDYKVTGVQTCALPISLLWLDLSLGPSSSSLNVSLRNDARNAVLQVALSLPRSKEFWVHCPQFSFLGKYLIPVLPVMSPTPGFLLFQIPPSLLPAVVLP